MECIPNICELSSSYLLLGGYSMDQFQLKELALHLFNLEDEDICSVDYSSENGNAIVHILLADNHRPACPRCDHHSLKIKEYVQKDITHSVLSNRKCIIRYKARRYQCLYCGKTFYETNPFCFHKQKLSILTVQNILRDLKCQNETFASISRRYHVSPTTVASLFDKYVNMKRSSLPPYMSWDECYAFHHLGYNSKYVCMLLDYQTASPVELLPSRREEYLLRYFDSIPKQERDNVKMISTDMWETYRIVIHRMFPKALLCLDHYHLSQEWSRQMDRVRIRIMKNYSKDTETKKSNEYYLLKKFNWILFKRINASNKDGDLFDPNRKKEFNKKLNRYLNYYDILELIKEIHPNFKEICDIKEDFMDFYDTNTAETAEDELNKLIAYCHASGIPEVREFSRTMKKWRTEIINSFRVIDQEYVVNKDTGQVTVSNKRISNGLMENRNGILKLIKKNANGYTNWDRFRNRCLYVLRKQEKAALEPLEEKEGE